MLHIEREQFGLDNRILRRSCDIHNIPDALDLSDIYACFLRRDQGPSRAGELLRNNQRNIRTDLLTSTMDDVNAEDANTDFVPRKMLINTSCEHRKHQDGAINTNPIQIRVRRAILGAWGKRVSYSFYAKQGTRVCMVANLTKQRFRFVHSVVWGETHEEWLELTCRVTKCGGTREISGIARMGNMVRSRPLVRAFISPNHATTYG